MDLSDRLCDKINALPNLPFTCFINYLSDNTGLSLVPVTGSTDIEFDWAGNAHKKVNYMVVIRDKNNSAMLESILWRITDMLENIKALPSKNNSYEFNSIQITGLPSLEYQDANNYSQYTLSFSVFIYQTKQQMEVN